MILLILAIWFAFKPWIRLFAGKNNRPFILEFLLFDLLFGRR